MSGLYRWYDRLPEPRRFLLFLTALILGTLGLGHFPIIGGLILAFLLITRIWHLRRAVGHGQ